MIDEFGVRLGVVPGGGIDIVMGMINKDDESINAAVTIHALEPDTYFYRVFIANNDSVSYSAERMLTIPW